jgi:Protein of unknown function (DUF4232)
MQRLLALTLALTGLASIAVMTGCGSSRDALKTARDHSTSAATTPLTSRSSTPQKATVTSGPPSSASSPPARCSKAEVAVTLGPRPGLASQERAAIIAIKNTGGRACAVSGYPAVALTEPGGRTLPFHYVNGGGPFVTKARPAAVVLPIGAMGYVLLAGSACTTEVDGHATAATLKLAGWTTSVSTTLVGSGQGSSLSLCRNDPSPSANTMWVSPVEKDLRSLVG